MFLSACRKVSEEYPNIKYDEDNLDRVCLSVNCLLQAHCTRHDQLKRVQFTDYYEPEAVL